jgi:hypothetical protein
MCGTGSNPIKIFLSCISEVAFLVFFKLYFKVWDSQIGNEFLQKATKATKLFIKKNSLS